MEYRGQQFVFEETRFFDHGGMGQVFEGVRQDDSSVRVAIKVPFPRQAATFLREAAAAQRVASPHVVPVVDWGDGPPFIAFQFIAGPTLRKVLNERRARSEYWPEADLVGLFRQLVDAMKAINAHVVHRDLTPGNIFDDAGTLRVTDFGLSKYVGDVTRADTQKGGGTFEYMAPEVWAFRDGRPDDAIDWRADQYSTGVLFYEMATLQRPFAGAEPDLKAGHLYKRPARVTDLIPSLSDRLASLIARMLEKQVGKRFASWDEIEGELEAIEQQRATAHDDFAAGVSRQAAAHIEQMRGRTLDQQRQEEERRQKAQQRLDLLAYWATEMCDHLQSRAESVNRRLGEEVLLFEHVTPSGPTRRCRVTFAGTEAQLVVELATLEPARPTEVVPIRVGGFPVPPDNILLWGIVEFNTPLRGDAFNVLLIEDNASPYGTWVKVRMTPQRGARIAENRQAFTDEEEKGRVYRVVAKNPRDNVFLREETVIALNWQALLLRRREPGQYGRVYTVLDLPYAEVPLVAGAFERELDKLIEALVANAAE